MPFLRLAFLAGSVTAILIAQDGAALYGERCAVCHDTAAGRTPAFSALKSMPAATILSVMESGLMQEQARGMSTTERRALADYLGTHSATGVPSGQGACAPNVKPVDRAGWAGFGATPENTRFQNRSAAGLSAADVPKLKLKWAFAVGETTSARGQPTLAGGRLYITGPDRLYALDPKSGCTFWSVGLTASVRSGVTVASGPGGRPAVFFGDSKANLYALDAQNGAQLWKVHTDEHGAAQITDASAAHEGVLYVGISSWEEVTGAAATYECCTFRGSVLAVDSASGRILWKSYTVDPPQPSGTTAAGRQRFGPSGAGVWSTPTIDPKRNVVYVATGDNYSDPTTRTSDAILALDRKTGSILWSRQMTAGDAFTVDCIATVTNCPDSKGPDFDFAQPPVLVTLPDGRRVLAIGQKSGVLHAIDPDNQGEVLWQKRLGKGGALGGIQWGSASDGRNVYVALSDLGFLLAKATDGSAKVTGLDPAAGGGLFAFDLATGQQVWNAKPAPCGERKGCSPAQSAAVTAIPGAVFAGSEDGHLRGYSTVDGRVIWDFDTVGEFPAVNGGSARGGAIDGGGPAVAGGMVFSYSGYAQWSGFGGNALLAFSVDGR
jgi:polyvinyl alcohol dehydrogenase (cytochrome)